MQTRQDQSLESVEVTISQENCREFSNALENYEQLREKEKQARIPSVDKPFLEDFLSGFDEQTAAEKSKIDALRQFLNELTFASEEFLSTEEAAKLSNALFDIFGQYSLAIVTKYAPNEILRLLFNDSRIDQAYDEYEGIMTAFHNDDIEKVQVYWDYSTIGHSSIAYNWGCSLTNPKVLAMLLAKPEVNPYPSLSEYIIERGKEEFLGVVFVVSRLRELDENNFRSVLETLESLDSADLLPLLIKAVAQNLEFVERLNTVFKHLNDIGCLTKENLGFVLQKAEQIDVLIQQLDDLYKLSIEKAEAHIRTPLTMGLLCQYPEYSETLGAIFSFLASNDVLAIESLELLTYPENMKAFDSNFNVLSDTTYSLFNETNMGLLLSNIQFSQGISIAFSSLVKNDKLNQENFITLMENPASAVYQARELGGAFAKDEEGFREFSEVRQAARILGEMFRGGRFPLDIGRRLLSEVNDQHFDEGTVQEIESRSMNKPA
ncbi:hypothetical protein BN59_01769 [Legionella massiliensis]|uniref:Uncharacterized protein n=1 Tax=Legionella massiliensis TaxID=1034943 RepID=A0A078KX02_9GAMM|nr:hypothetical protein [Legionella massiliensis]CDZ77486.1 hypothetical protein BN59_01769 [Legionella massiliensis]CEE13224.1 hypothetical protein BN1094_01769 [Legionella massiliensis]